MTRHVSLVAVAVAAACAIAPGRGELTAQVQAVPIAADTWIDEDGHEIVLEEAVIGLEGLYLHEPGDVRAARLSPLDLLLPAAHAHPGHDDSGDVAGELLGTWIVDLLGGPVQLGIADVYEGDLASATLGLADVPVLLEGTVTDEQGTRPFSFELVPDQDLTGLPLQASFTASDAPTLHVEVDAAWILSFVDWDAADTDGDGVLTEADDELAQLVAFGIHSTGAYAVRVAEGG